MSNKSKYKIILIARLSQSYILGKYFFNLLNSSMLGILLIAILIYFWGPITPYSGSELVDWFVGLPDAAKLSIGTSSLTIIGFLIAFQVGSSNAIKQLNLTYRMSAADEITHFYQDASEKILAVKLFAKRILETIDILEKNDDPSEVAFAIHYSLNEMVRHEKSIPSLQAFNNSYSLTEKHGLLLRNHIGLMRRLDISNDLLSEVHSNSYVPIGIKIQENINPRSEFLAQIDKEKYSNLYDAANNAYDYIFDISYAIRNALNSKIIGHNLLSTLSIVKDLNNTDNQEGMYDLILKNKTSANKK